MSQKYALIIGNNQHDDPAWHDLKTPELDAEAVAAVLDEPKIGGFDRVVKLLNASVPQMRIAIAELFDTRAHQPDDLLLLYFSGHGELDSHNHLYLVGRETRRGPMVRATGLEASYITGCMDGARSRRQVIILDSCYSGAFGQSPKGGVPTKEIFAGNGYGRHILTASEALQLSWEGDEALGQVENSFFTHFLVEGLRTGAADRDNDGLIHIDELYDHIREGMAKQSRKQTPLKFSLQAAGDLIIARSPISPFQRAREQLTDLIVQAENAAERGDYRRAERLLNQVIEAEPEGLLGISARQMLAEIMAERQRAVAYDDVKRLAGRSKRAGRAAWQAFSRQYPGYDPDDLAALIPEEAAPPPQPKSGTTKTPLPPATKKPAPPLQEQKPEAVKKPQILRVEALLPPPFAWVEIPAGQVTIEGKVYQVAPFSIAKYPLTNAQFAPFIEAGGYREKKWWTEAGWQAREQGWDWDSKESKWKPTGRPWTEPRYWQDKKWNGAEQPVVGVSWYEAVAYCIWLGQKTGQQIMLPTEDQWQYAAQGDDGRAYPWGNDWDSSRCRNSVDGGLGSAGNTSPVTEYEGKGDSPFGVVDMAGNVWEWCLTEYESGNNDLDGTNVRVLRGGSWYGDNSENFRVSYRFRYDPDPRVQQVRFSSRPLLRVLVYWVLKFCFSDRERSERLVPA